MMIDKYRGYTVYRIAVLSTAETTCHPQNDPLITGPKLMAQKSGPFLCIMYVYVAFFFDYQMCVSGQTSYLPILSRGQLIKSVCVCQCVCPSASTLTVAFLDRFSPKLAQTSKPPIKKNEFVGGQHRTTPFPFCPRKLPFWAERS